MPCCEKCKKEMVGIRGHPPWKWSCECGITASLESKREIDKARKAGFLPAIAEEGKRIISIRDWDRRHYLIYEEPI